ncbi:MAG TPA: hypothetical protein VG204_02685 [Terriglobia bacterium]|nr:hypothetical protein [Terriglobia bacterium]
MPSEEQTRPPETLTLKMEPQIVKLAEPYPLDRLLAPSSDVVWRSVPVGPTTAKRIGTAGLTLAPQVAGHTFSALETPGVKEALKSFADIELPDLEGEAEDIQVIFSTAKVLSELTSPSQKPTFQKWIFYPKQLLPIINAVVELVGRSHPALQNLKPGLGAVAFIIKTTEGVYAIVCELKKEKPPKSF